MKANGLMGDQSGLTLLGLLAGTIAVVAAVLAASIFALDFERTTPPARKTPLAAAPVPKPDFARVLPANYRARHVWYRRLTGGSVPDAVITSIGPPTGSSSSHSADIQVLSWDAIARRWEVWFDAQRLTGSGGVWGPLNSNAPIATPAPSTPASSTPILDPKADTSVTQVGFANFAPGLGTDLVFTSTASFGASGSAQSLYVVGFPDTQATIVYEWSGQGLDPFRIGGNSPHQHLLGKAWYWTPEDSHCCPLRTYTFVIQPTPANGGRDDLGVVKDERPWLGVFVTPVRGPDDPSSPVRVVGVVEGSPAARALRQGDVLLALDSGPKLASPPSLGPSLVDELISLDAGDRAVFTVRRGGATIRVSVRLGSMIDSSALTATPPRNYTVSTI